MRELNDKMYVNSRTYTQTYTPTVVQEGGGWTPPPEFLICCSISQRFYLQWKAFDLLNNMTSPTIVAINSRHLEFY